MMLSNISKGFVISFLVCAAISVVNAGATVRKQAPSFTGTAVINKEFKDISLESFKGKYLILLFYPLDFTFVCPTELIAYSDHMSEFRKLNAEVVAVSIDSKYTHLAFVNTPRKDGGLGTVEIPLVSDITKQISRDYGVLVEGDNDPEAGVALRGLFIIDGKGIVKHISINDLPVGRSVEETLRLVQAFQYADSHDGEGCPINWRPGLETLRTNPAESKEYFKKMYAEL